MNANYTTSVEGLGKRSNLFQFLFAVPPQLSAILKKGSVILINDQVQVTLKESDGEYASFELTLNELTGTSLVEVEVGSSVELRLVNT